MLQSSIHSLSGLRSWISSFAFSKKYLALSEDGKKSLVTVLKWKKIWEGNIGEVYEAKVNYLWRNMKFALKCFKNDYWIRDLKYGDRDFIKESLKIHPIVKKAGLPTWNTYRHLKWTNKILMTLGNADWTLLFSPKNQSKDRDFVKKHYSAEKIINKQEFFQQSWDFLKIAKVENIYLPVDLSYTIKENNLSLFVGDLDLVYLSVQQINFRSFLFNFLESLFYLERDCGIALYDDFIAFLREEKQWEVHEFFFDDRLKSFFISEVS